MSKTLSLDGYTAHYLEAGTGETLLLLHGVGMQAAAWQPQIEHFAKNYRVIALDMAGHGGSSLLPDNVRLPDYVAWTAKFIQALNIGAVNVAGHSMGSLIAGGLAVEYPQLVKRVALLNAVYKRTDVAKAAVIARAKTLKDGNNDIDTPINRWFDDSQADIARQVRDWLCQVNLDGYAAAYTAFAYGDDVYANRLGDIVCPALVLTGDGDPNSTAQMAMQMASVIPNATGIVIDDARHMVNLTHPDVVNQHLENWLSSKI